MSGISSVVLNRRTYGTLWRIWLPLGYCACTVYSDSRDEHPVQGVAVSHGVPRNHGIHLLKPLACSPAPPLLFTATPHVSLWSFCIVLRAVTANTEQCGFSTCDTRCHVIVTFLCTLSPPPPKQKWPLTWVVWPCPQHRSTSVFFLLV